MLVATAGIPFDLPKTSEPAAARLADYLQHEPGGWVASCPGLLAVGDTLVLVLHRSQAPKSQGLLSQAQLHLTVLHLFATGTRRSVKKSAHELGLSSVGQGQGLLDQLEAAVCLWNDHQRNGPIVVAEPLRSHRTPGRIDWRRSQFEGVPVQGLGGEVYQSFVRTRVRRSSGHPLVALHRRTIQEIAALLRTGTRGAKLSSGCAARSVLDRYGRQVFEQRLKRVATLLSRYHKPAGAGETHGHSDVSALVATHYEQLWEEMLRVALGHEPQESDQFSGAYYVTGQKPQTKLVLKPDILSRAAVDGHNVRLVLDAKDYAEGTWPATHDLTKQILYRLMLSNRIYEGEPDLKQIGNAFLFPGSQKEGVSLRGVHRLHGKVAGGEPGTVVGLSVNLERVARAYVGGRTDQDLLERLAALVMREYAEVLDTPG